MRIIDLDDISPGSKLAKDLFSAAGTLLFPKDSVLGEKELKILKELDIYGIYIVDNHFPDLEAVNIISEDTRRKAVKTIKATAENISQDRGMETCQIVAKVGKIVEETANCSSVLVNLSDIRSIDDYIFSHSVNTCILSVLLAASIGYSGEKLNNLALAAMLHDLGMTLLPKELVNKKGKYCLKEYEKIQEHCLLGYQLIKWNFDNEMAAEIVYQHHERYDGKGYPRNFLSGNICEEARILSIADVYDALTSYRPYRKRFLPHEAYEYMNGKGVNCFDRELLEIFFRHIALYPTGTLVLLSTGQKGIVVDQNSNYPLCPIVRVLEGEKEKTMEYDLLFKKDIFIISIIKG